MRFGFNAGEVGGWCTIWHELRVLRNAFKRRKGATMKDSIHGCYKM